MVYKKNAVLKSEQHFKRIEEELVNSGRRGKCQKYDKK